MGAWIDGVVPKGAVVTRPNPGVRDVDLTDA
jgi:hypothetical protein